MLEVEKHFESLRNSMHWVGLATGKSWEQYRTNFFEYFNHPEKHIKAKAVFMFYGMLQQWEDGSSFTFKVYETQPEMFHKLDHYLKAFLNHSDEIAEEFPGIHCAIANVLKRLDDEEKFGYRFPKIGGGLFRRMRDTLFKDEILNRTLEENCYIQAHIEVGLSKEYM